MVVMIIVIIENIIIINIIKLRRDVVVVFVHGVMVVVSLFVLKSV